MQPIYKNTNEIINVSNIQTIPPYLEHQEENKFFWGDDFGGKHSIEKFNEQSFFAQSKICQDFPFTSLIFEKTKGTSPASNVILSQSLITKNEWLDRQTKKESPFIHTSEKIALDALTPALVLNLSSGKEPSQSSGQLSIQALRRFIASGYTYTYLFLKKSRKNERSYSISIVIDSTMRVFSSVNIVHSTYTIASFLGSLAHIPDSDIIKVNVICCSHSKAQILLIDVPAISFQSFRLISDILSTCHHYSELESGVGTGLNVAYQLALQQNSVDHKIFVFTDGVVTKLSEINELGAKLIQCELFSIQVVAIGLGICPLHLNSIFPSSIHTINPEEIGSALAYTLGISTNTSQSKIKSIVLTPLIDDIQEVIESLQKPSEFNQKLEESIKNRKISKDFFNNIGDPDAMFNVTGLTENTEIEPYSDGQFSDFNILVVVLYMGEAGSKDESINPKTFDSGCGEALKQKGFSYTLVFSYGDAIEELKKDIDGQCPYCEVWIFCSPGYGELSTIAKSKAKDQDLNKIIPFLNAVRDFWLSGGGLFVFSDNEPFTFEINYLLENIMTFNDGVRSGPTKVRFTGKYDNPNKEKAWIEVIKNDSSSVGKFIMADEMDSPGKCPFRFTLRPGLVKFFEGTTISEATDESGAQLSEDDLWPFKAFAWTTDTSNNPHPFILYFDPPIPCDPERNNTLGIKSPGPIILHGGLTSAFAEFHTGGTERLITSIACWLTRFEERQFNAQKSGQDLVTTVPALRNSYNVSSPFTGWNRKVAPKHSILILDGSDSMKKVYGNLIVCANEYISTCERNGGLVSVVEFDSSAQILRPLDNRRLAEKEGYRGRGTRYSAGLSTAIPLIDRTPPNYECRILFFTDGCPNHGDYYDGYLSTIRSKGVRLDAVGFGDVNQDTLNKLCQNGGTATIGKTMTEVGQIMQSYAF